MDLALELWVFSSPPNRVPLDQEASLANGNLKLLIWIRPRPFGQVPLQDPFLDQTKAFQIEIWEFLGEGACTVNTPESLEKASQKSSKELSSNEGALFSVMICLGPFRGPARTPTIRTV